MQTIEKPTLPKFKSKINDKEGNFIYQEYSSDSIIKNGYIKKISISTWQFIALPDRITREVELYNIPGLAQAYRKLMELIITQVYCGQ